MLLIKRLFRYSSVFIVLVLFSTCADTNRELITRLVKEWEGKTIVFPQEAIFTIQARDTIEMDMNVKDYKVVVYVDSAGCTGCRLQLPEWSRLIAEIDTLRESATTFLFFLTPKSIADAKFITRRDNFTNPICIDLKNEIDRLNHFPTEGGNVFHTFLLDKDNRVVAIGNPIHNRSVRKLYIEILTGKQQHSDRETTVEASSLSIRLGSLKIGEKRESQFVLKNIGSAPLIIYDVITSCGCTVATFEHAPVGIGKETSIKLIYTADEQGMFNKSITVHCNAANTPLRLQLMGEVN